ncbi:SusC/RagA family TonB-linked outer membrane protein [Odoribacter sp. AF15-53]|mgnify:CR=1 FL=1|nr:SusC/RagA family TonB-linked outer membrane protein [Odoribacter sp. AF15-53]RHR79056.1 SusC/RagA family TonB-linked outer membrane protein [Odoribacter sp. AF15-53]
MKKNGESGFCSREKLRLFGVFMKVSLLIVLINFPVRNFAQEKRFTFELKNVSVSAVYLHIEKNSDYSFVYNPQEIRKIGLKDYTFKDATIREILEYCLKGSDLTYEIRDKHVIIRRDNEKHEGREMILVQGKVVGKDGSALPGVSVLLKGTTTGVTTNSEGNYSFFIPKQENVVLVFSFVGMKREEVKYTGKDVINVTMEEDVKSMEEVVVTGYQNIRKTDMVGSAQKVRRDELFFNGTNSLEQMLQGKIAGAVVNNTSGLVGARQKVRVRGTSTLLGNQEPVWVVDGIIQEDPLPFKAQEFSSTGAISNDNFDMVRNFVGNAISWLNPNDIEDITVLKDAAATVLYGVKAANGVIVITTRKGSKGRMAVNYSGNFSISSRLTYDKMHLMNSQQRIEASREIYNQRLVYNGRTLEDVGYEGVLKKFLNKQVTYDEFNAEVKRLEEVNTDWFDLLYRNPFSHNHSLSISGGTDKITYYWSLGVSENKGAAKGNDQQSYNSLMKMTFRLNDKLLVNAQLNGDYSETNGFYVVNPYQYARTTSRAIPCFNEDGTHFFYPSKNSTGMLSYNVLNELENTGNKNNKKSLGTTVNLRYTILEGLNFESLLGLTYSGTTGESYASERSFYIAQKRGYDYGLFSSESAEYKKSQLPHGGELNTTNDQNLTVTWRNTLAYDHVFKRHRLGVFVGFECRSSKYDGTSATTYGYFPDRGKTVTLPPLQYTIGTAKYDNPIYTLFIKNNIVDKKSNYMSYFGSLTYSFAERYVVTGSIRSDASNRFGQDTKHRFLPTWSIGGVWHVVNESWMHSQNLFNELSFRATYGWQGNVAENYGPNLVAKIMGLEYYTKEFQLKVKSLPYGDLRWEKTKTVNLGIDIGLLKNRLMVTAEYYHKKTEDVILNKEVAYEYGVNSMPINGGNLYNKGWELSIAMTPVRTRDFLWTLSFNTSKNYNKMDSQTEQNKNWRTAVSGSLVKDGYALSSIWAFEFTGLTNEGRPTFYLPSKEEMPEAAKDATVFLKYAGTLDPDFAGGISTSFRYKTLTLSASFNVNIGSKRFLDDLFPSGTEVDVPSAYLNLSKDMVDCWKKPGDEKVTNIPNYPSVGGSAPTTSVVGSEYLYRMYNYSDIRVVNGSFFRCNNISLNYTFPESIVKRLRLTHLALTAGVTNPFIIVSSEYKGVDPEVATGSQPIVKTFSLGLNVSF